LCIISIHIQKLRFKKHEIENILYLLLVSVLFIKAILGERRKAERIIVYNIQHSSSQKRNAKYGYVCAEILVKFNETRMMNHFNLWRVA
jgi:hypothetical protein